MRSTSRRFLVAVLLTAAAGFALSQEASAPPPPPVPDVAAPVAEPPQLPVVAVAPVADPNAPAVDPALTIDPSALAVAPAAEATAQVPEPEKLVVTTTARRVTRKSATKPVSKPAIEVETIEPAPAPVAASTALAKSVEPAPPAAKTVPVESPSEKALPERKLGIGSWILFGVAFVALAAIARRFLRRQVQSPTAIVDFTGSSRLPELKPAPVPRP
jgi:hypothetical protein